MTDEGDAAFADLYDEWIPGEGLRAYDTPRARAKREAEAAATAIAADETGFTERPGSHADLERLLDEIFAGFPEGWTHRPLPTRAHTREVVKRLFVEWKTHLTLEDRWAHCGAYRAHDEHHHKVALNEGASRVRCVGTPDLLAPSVPAPPSGPDVRKLLEGLAAPTLNEWYDELRAHLRDTHRNDAALRLTDAQVADQHFAEHAEPGGLSDHGEPVNLHDFRGVNYVVTVRPDGVAPEDVVPTPPLHEMHTGRPDEYDDEYLRALRPGSQTPPTTSDREGAHDALLRGHLRESLAERRLLGLARYHTLLQAGNGRDSLRDATEEVLDLAAYLQVWTQARDEALELLSEMRAALARRGELWVGETRAAHNAEYVEKIRRIEHLLGGGAA